jgi:hypothetical protein
VEAFCKSFRGRKNVNFWNYRIFPRAAPSDAHFMFRFEQKLAEENQLSQFHQPSFHSAGENGVLCQLQRYTGLSVVSS